MDWCAGTWCYLKSHLRAVGRDNTEPFMACCFGKWHVPHDGQGLCCISAAGVAPWEIRAHCLRNCLVFSLFDPAAPCSPGQLPLLHSIIFILGKTQLVCGYWFSKLAGNVQFRPLSQASLAPRPHLPSSTIPGPDPSAVHPQEAIKQQLQAGGAISAGIGINYRNKLICIALLLL